MAHPSGLLRKTHLLGGKIRSIRKRNGLTLEDVSVRCIQLDPRNAPSVSYLSLIENGKRIPSERLLELLAELFQKDVHWFLDENVQIEPAPGRPSSGGVEGMSLEPGFLFSKELLETAIPELLSQTGTSGRQFAHVLIRSYQEKHRNQFPDLERAAEEVGRKRFPVSVEDLLALCRRHQLRIHWFDRAPFVTRDDAGRELKSLFRSFYEPPGTVHLNRQLENEPARLKYDLAGHLAHKVLHDGDGLKSSHATGGELGGSPRPLSRQTDRINQEDILFAWRDFECSFFAGALLCPRLPFRRFLIREAYDVHCGGKVELTPAVVMRRMTAVSPYRDWHYFDAYPPGYLRAVYRGNGIPLPWGNMRLVTDPCREWAIFRMLSKTHMHKPLVQLSLLETGGRARLYSCIALRAKDAAGNPHVISTGVELMPALESQGIDAAEVAGEIQRACGGGGGSAAIPDGAREKISLVAKVLNISWVDDGLNAPAYTICPRSSDCPRSRPCETRPASRRRVSWLSEIKQEILDEASVKS